MALRHRPSGDPSEVEISTMAVFVHVVLHGVGPRTKALLRLVPRRNLRIANVEIPGMRAARAARGGNRLVGASGRRVGDPGVRVELLVPAHGSETRLSGRAIGGYRSVAARRVPDVRVV